MGEDPRSSAPPKWLSVPGLVVVAALGAALAVLARLVGPENVLRAVVTELIASFGSTVLVLALFGLLFRSVLERLVRRAPGGEALAESAQRLGELVQDLNRHDLARREHDYEAKLERIEEDVHSLLEAELPALRRELAQLRTLLANSERGD